MSFCHCFCLISSVRRVGLRKIAVLWDQYDPDTSLALSKNLYQAKSHLQKESSGSYNHCAVWAFTSPLKRNNCICNEFNWLFKKNTSICFKWFIPYAQPFTLLSNKKLQNHVTSFPCTGSTLQFRLSYGEFQHCLSPFASPRLLMQLGRVFMEAHGRAACNCRSRHVHQSS